MNGMTAQLAQLGDTQLMAGVLQGSQSAFATLVARHQARGFALAWRVLGDAAEAEDALQDAFLKVWTNAELYAPTRGNFSGWLTRIVINSALDRKRSIRSVCVLGEAAQTEDERPRADRQLESSDLHRIMASMPPRQRAVITLFYLEGYSMAEIADMMESSSKAVESMLSRGRSALRGLLSAQEQAA